MQDLKLQDKITRGDNAGPDYDGQNSRGEIARPENVGRKYRADNDNVTKIL